MFLCSLGLPDLQLKMENEKKMWNGPLNLKLIDELMFSIRMHDVLFGTYLYAKKQKQNPHPFI